METTQNNSKMAVLGQNHPLIKIIKTRLLRFNRGHRFTFIDRISCRSVPLQKEVLHCTRYKKEKKLFAAILRAFGPGCQNFNTWDLSSA